MLELFGGLAFTGVGIWLLVNNIIETKKGYRDEYGNDIGLYSASVIFIMVGITLIYKALTTWGKASVYWNLKIAKLKVYSAIRCYNC